MPHKIKGHQFDFRNHQNHEQRANHLAQRGRKRRKSVLIDFREVLVALLEAYFDFCVVGFRKNLGRLVVAGLLPELVPLDQSELLELIFEGGLLPFDPWLDFAFAAEGRLGDGLAFFGFVFGEDLVFIMVGFLLEGLFVTQRS